MTRRRRTRDTRAEDAFLPSEATARLLAQLHHQQHDTAARRPDQDPASGELRLTYTPLGNGRGVRVTSPDLPGWASVARTTADFARTVIQGRQELAIVAYAARRGEAYDAAHHDPPSVQPDTGKRRYPERYNPAAWTPLPGGAWRSPSGRTYKATSDQARKVARKRRDLGLPTTVTDTGEAT